MAKKIKTPNIILPADPIVRLSLNSFPKPAKAIRANLSCGEHGVDFSCTVRGSLRVAADGMTRQVNKLKPRALAKLLADKLPTSIVDSCINEAVRAMLATAGNEDAEDGEEESAEIEGSSDDDLQARTQASLGQIAPLIQIPKKGAVKFFGTVTAVNP